MNSPRVLIITPDRDTRGSDFSKAFSPESDHLMKLYEDSVCVLIDVSRDEASRRRQVLDALQGAGHDAPLDLVAILCHGWRSGIQLGFSLSKVPDLAAALATAGTPRLSVALYACSTAQDDGTAPGTAGNGGFADTLRDCLVRCLTRDGTPATGCRIDAHTCAGDCTSNPYVRRMEGDRGDGGDWLIEPHSELWATWCAALRDHHGSTLRFRFPLMTSQQVRAELAGAQKEA